MKTALWAGAQYPEPSDTGSQQLLGIFQQLLGILRDERGDAHRDWPLGSFLFALLC